MENFVSNILLLLLLLDFLRSIRPISVAAAVGQEQQYLFSFFILFNGLERVQTIFAHFLDPAAHRAVLRCRIAEADAGPHGWRME